MASQNQDVSVASSLDLARRGSGSSLSSVNEASEYLGALMLAGEYDRARAQAEQWHRQARDNPNHAYYFARFLVLEDAVAGLKWYEGLTNNNTKNLNWLVFLANLQIEAGLGRTGLATIREFLSLSTRLPDVFSAFALKSLYVQDVDPVENLAAFRKLASRHFGAAVPVTWSVSKRPRYNIGFVCGNLRKHAISAFLMPLLTCLDRKNFMVVVFSSSSEIDAVTHALQKMCDVWYDTSSMSDPELLALIRSDRLDVLIDLDNHSQPNRLWVFAQRAAPIQMSFYGLNLSTGLDSMDYRLTDLLVDPAGSEGQYVEKLVRTRSCHVAYLGTTFPFKAAPCQKNGYLRFGSFNHWSKIDQFQVDRWAAVLRKHADSHLTVVGFDDAFAVLRLERWILQAGIDRNRISIEGRLTPRELYERIQSVDLAIDTWPFGGGVTTATTLSLGVPVVTALGPRAHSRVSASMLRDLDLDHYVVESPDQLAIGAAEVCADAVALSADRARVMQRFAETIGNGERLAAEVGELLIRAIERHRRGKSADHDAL